MEGLLSTGPTPSSFIMLPSHQVFLSVLTKLKGNCIRWGTEQMLISCGLKREVLSAYCLVKQEETTKG